MYKRLAASGKPYPSAASGAALPYRRPLSSPAISTAVSGGTHSSRWRRALPTWIPPGVDPSRRRLLLAARSMGVGFRHGSHAAAAPPHAAPCRDHPHLRTAGGQHSMKHPRPADFSGIKEAQMGREMVPGVEELVSLYASGRMHSWFRNT